MNSRITLISYFDEFNLNKINKIVGKIDEKLCKIPFGKGVNDRFLVDTLPWHFTLSSWNINKMDDIINSLRKISFNKFSIKVDSLGIMNGAEDSYVLYFNVIFNDKLKLLHKTIYNMYPNEYYNPEKFKFHITVHIDKDYEKILKIKKQIEDDFVPFELEVNALGLFEIYPAKLIYQFSGN